MPGGFHARRSAVATLAPEMQRSPAPNSTASLGASNWRIVSHRRHISREEMVKRGCLITASVEEVAWLRGLREGWISLRSLVDEDARRPAPPPYMTLGPAYAQPLPMRMPPDLPPPELETTPVCVCAAQPKAWDAALKPLSSDRLTKSEVVLHSETERSADAIKPAHGCLTRPVRHC